MDLTGNNRILDRAEPFSIRELRDWQDTRAFREFSRKLDQLIESERRVCEMAEGGMIVRRAQGALKALLLVKRLPQILEQEMELEGKK